MFSISYEIGTDLAFAWQPVAKEGRGNSPGDSR